MRKVSLIRRQRCFVDPDEATPNVIFPLHQVSFRPWTEWRSNKVFDSGQL